MFFQLDICHTSIVEIDRFPPTKKKEQKFKNIKYETNTFYKKKKIDSKEFMNTGTLKIPLNLQLID